MSSDIGGITYAPHEHPKSLLYWQLLHGAYASMFEVAPSCGPECATLLTVLRAAGVEGCALQAMPGRAVVALHNYCGSYGMLKHMEPARRSPGMPP